jgi:hypothetical protein
MEVTWQYRRRLLNRRALGSDIEIAVLKPIKTEILSYEREMMDGREL